MERIGVVCLFFLSALFLAGCGGGSIIPLATTASVTSVSATCSPASVDTGQTSQCSAAITGTGTDGQSVTWSAVSGSINSSGVYQAPSVVPASGTDIITATSTLDRSKWGSTPVHIGTATTEPSVTKVSVTATPSSIGTSQTSTCSATVAGTGAYNSAVTWTATGGAITQAGVFTPSGTGAATCIATSTQAGFTNISGSANITVTSAASAPTVTGITVKAAPSAISTSQTSTCSATVQGTGAYSTAVTWTATGGVITQEGVFTPSGTGTAKCIATSTQAGYTTVSGSAAIAVTATAPPVTVTGITVTATPSSITTSQTSTCSATVAGTGAYSTAVTWTATGGAITQAGVLTPSGAGTARCIATSAQAGYTAITGAANITVTAPTFTVTSITVAATPASITTAQTSTCAATVAGTGTYSTAVTWTATGGTITTGGVFTPSAAGTATCTAHSAAAGFTTISGSASIAITAGAPAVTGVTLVCSPTSITTSQTSTCTPTVTGSGAFTDTVNLAVSPAADGSLSTSTNVASGTGVTFNPATTGAETATITATSTENSAISATTTIAVTVASAGPSCAGMSLGDNASLNGFVPFPANSAWNTNISAASLDPNATAIEAGADFAGEHLHANFSSVAGGDYGMPYVVVDSSTTPLVPLSIVAYASQSDVAYAPVPATAPVEGSPGNCVGGPTNYINDQHVLVLDRNRCMLYETFNSTYCNGTWSADSETIWDLKNYEQRPWGWTSADAAGLPVFPGLLRYDEVAAGVINHAIRITIQNTKSDNNGGYFVLPASHAAGSSSSSLNVMGMRIRLKASFDISGFSAVNQVILTALKNYGMIVADNGGNFYLQGVPDSRWNDSDLQNLASVTSNNFEVVQMTPTYPGYDADTAPTGPPPTINSFTASATTVAAGTPVTLTWTTANDSYDFIDKLGAISGGTVTFIPTATNTYTLNATNQYGRSTAKVTVTVQ